MGSLARSVLEGPAVDNPHRIVTALARRRYNRICIRARRDVGVQARPSAVSPMVGLLAGVLGAYLYAVGPFFYPSPYSTSVNRAGGLAHAVVSERERTREYELPRCCPQ